MEDRKITEKIIFELAVVTRHHKWGLGFTSDVPHAQIMESDYWGTSSALCLSPRDGSLTPFHTVFFILQSQEEKRKLQKMKNTIKDYGSLALNQGILIKG